jgi:hypothetical protein
LLVRRRSLRGGPPSAVVTAGPVLVLPWVVASPRALPIVDIFLIVVIVGVLPVASGGEALLDFFTRHRLMVVLALAAHLRVDARGPGSGDPGVYLIDLLLDAVEVEVDLLHDAQNALVLGYRRQLDLLLALLSFLGLVWVIVAPIVVFIIVVAIATALFFVVIIFIFFVIIAAGALIFVIFFLFFFLFVWPIVLYNIWIASGQ